jgi:hypothetical protein
MSALKHFLKHRIGIALATGRSQGVLVIDSRKEDDFGLGVKPKKQSKPSPNLRPTPVTKCGARRFALPLFFAVGVTRHGLQFQLRHGIEKLTLAFASNPCGSWPKANCAAV